MVDNSKRRLLFLPAQSENNASLPWLKNTHSFQQDCTQCGECLTRCETNIIVKGPNGFPVINFDIGECTFCYACADVCEEPIFFPQSSKPWQKAAHIKEDCLAHNNVVCRSCSEACEPLAIQFQLQLGKAALPSVDESACTGCGACVSVCPTSSIDISTIDNTTLILKQ